MIASKKAFLCTFLWIFLEIGQAKVYDLTNVTPNLIFNNESIVKLYDYGSHVLIGGRNAIYNVSLNERELGYSTHKWNASLTAVAECGKIFDAQAACHNDIRVYYPYRSGFVLCGTYALSPMCAQFEDGKLIKQFSGLGQTPPQSEHRSKFLATGSHVFTATVADFSATDPLLLRRDLDGSSSSQLRSPRQGAFEEPEFIEIHSNYQDVLVWFTEAPTDTEKCGMRKETRVARVCARDPGAARPHETEFSSFSKARVECAISEQQQDTLYFNQLKAIKRMGSTRLIGVFQSQLAGLGASALCEFDTADISRTLQRKFEGYQSSSCPRATSQDAQLATRSNPMVEKKISSKPFYYAFDGKDRFTALTIEENFEDIDGRKMDLIWVGTDRGNVLKLIRSPNKTIHVSTMKIAKEAIQELTLVKKKLLVQNGQKNVQWNLIAVTGSGVYRAPASACTQVDGCLECTQMGDPMCAWITDKCYPINEHLHRRPYMVREPMKCVETAQSVNSATQPSTTRRRAMPKELIAFRSPECLCERREETTPCGIAEVIQNEVPSRSGYLPCLLFTTFGCFLGACATYMCTWWCRSPKEKPSPSPIIDAFTQSTSPSMQSDMSTRTGYSSHGPLIQTSSKQTYC
ncbi:unnamed protein product, partial [Mesorhabditis belari]|uniref:Sema domain-containing protein n=1 Tax=Mesorhabditis belari TaxID=2138241 RepID=A0AAF3F817_9BILA